MPARAPVPPSVTGAARPMPARAPFPRHQAVHV
jgi:hypothetical protein